MKKIISLTVSLVLSLLLCVPCIAGERLTPLLYRDLLEEKYGIDISFNEVNGRAEITYGTLESLDMALSSMTAPIVQQVSNYYEGNYGKRLEVVYITSESEYLLGEDVLMAAFEEKTSRIYVFIPRVSGEVIVSGENPTAFVHEFAHAFHVMALAKHGWDIMQAEWAAFNDSYEYSGYMLKENPDDTTFITPYAAYSFFEDFAETFSHTFVRNTPGTGFKDKLSNGSAPTNLGLKVNYIEELIKSVLSDADEAVDNYRRIHSTAVGVRFEGMYFSGEYMQYAGYPQPKNILSGILKAIDVVSKRSTWIRQIGAWRVIDRNDNMLYVFPGGVWASSGKPGIYSEGAA